MREQTTATVNVIRQIYRHNEIVFRIYASVHKLPKTSLSHTMPVYELKIGTTYPYPMYLNGKYMHDALDWKSAFSILTERVNTISRQFGLSRIYLKQYQEIET